MPEFVANLFDTTGFPARWRCGTWTPAQGWLHILSDLGIWSAYLAIPCVLVYFALRRRNLPFKYIFVLFGLFILACGTTHLMDAVVFWWPAYRLAGVLKLFTAVVSWATVLALIHVAPKAFALRSQEELERETSQRKRVEELANAMPQMVWTAPPDGRMDYYNDRWYEYTGLPRAARGTAGWKSVIHPDDVAKCQDTWDAAVGAGGGYELEYRIREHASGRYRWHLGRALPVRGAAGVVERWIGTCTDIEAQKRAEEDLRHHEEQFHTLSDSIPQLAWVARADGHIDWYNKRWYDYTGTTPRDMEGWGWQAVHDPAALPKVLERWKRSIASGDPFEMVIPLRGADGNFRPFLTRVQPLRGPDGHVQRWFGTNTDITEQVRTEDHLRHAREELEERVRNRTAELGRAAEGIRQNEQRYRLLVEATTAIVWSVPASGEVGADLPAWAAFTGQTPEQIRQWGWLDAVHPEDRARTAGVWSEAVATRSPYLIEHRLRRRDGDYRHMLARGIPVLGDGGDVLEWVGVHTDVTDQKRAEAAQRDAKEAAEAVVRVKGELLATLQLQIDERRRAEEALLHTRAQLMDAIESLDAGLVMYGPDERMVVCNAKYKEIYAGAAHMMVPGTPYEDILRAFFRAGAVSHAGLDEDEWVGNRLGAHRNPGLPHEQSLSGRWVRISDRHTSTGGVVSLRTDITAFKKALEAAEEANRAKSEFLANMSHEIRTPLNGILGMTELTLDTGLTREQRENLGMVKTSADSLVQVINDILDFSKIEAGRLELDPAPFALRDSLGATVQALGLRASEKGVELICRIGTDVPDWLVGDPLRLRQVMTNLVGNAIKFTERGEVVVVVGVGAVAGEPAEADADAVRLHVSVRDTGIGIPKNKQDSIFHAFTQVDASTTRRYGGTGLGLAITSQLVALMGGRVRVESEAGAGSTFHFTARLGRHPGPAPRLLYSGADLEGLPVLVVDDNDTSRGMLEEILFNWRMRPTAVSTGSSAVAAMRQAAAAGEPFPLVLLDAVMPDPDGFRVAEELNRAPGLAGAAIMMLSSADRGGDADRCRQLGVARYLRKPVTQSELFNSILTALGAAAADPTESPAAGGAGGAGAPDGTRGLRVLLAEDNEVNQELAVRALRKRGHTVVVAGTGREALAALEAGPVDIVLMDVQMPEMDGFAAAAAVRAREAVTGGHVPIVALTAHAMKGDRERCLAAGMDAYMSKPLRVAELFQVIARLVPDAPAAAEPPAEPPAAAESAATGFDPVSALARVEGDRPLLRKMIGMFFAQADKLLPEIRGAVGRGDGPALERAAHKIKGSMGSFGAAAAVGVALRVEVMGRDGEFGGAPAATADLEREVGRLREALASFTGEDMGCES